MGIYNGTSDVIKKDLMDLREMLIRAKSKSEASFCIDSIYTLEHLYNSLKNVNSSYYDHICKKNRNKVKTAINLKNKYLDAHIENFISNKIFLRELFFENIELFSDMLEQNYEKDSITEAVFSEASADLIIHDFFTRFYPEHIDYIDKLILEKRLVKVDMLENYEGVCFNIYKKEPLILVQNRGFTLGNIQTLIHELAHAIDFKDMNQKFSVNKREKYNYQSNYIEFLSRLYERQALDYFYDLRLDEASIMSHYLDYDQIVYDGIVESYTFSLLPDEVLRRSNYLKYSSDELKLMIPCECFIEPVEETLDDESLDINSSLRYSISSLFAMYCNGLLKENPEKGQYVFENIMANRTDMFRKEIFEELGINGQEMSKILKKEMNYNQK